MGIPTLLVGWNGAQGLTLLVGWQTQVVHGRGSNAQESPRGFAPHGGEGAPIREPKSNEIEAVAFAPINSAVRVGTRHTVDLNQTE